MAFSLPTSPRKVISPLPLPLVLPLSPPTQIFGTILSSNNHNMIDNKGYEGKNEIKNIIEIKIENNTENKIEHKTRMKLLVMKKII